MEKFGIPTPFINMTRLLFQDEAVPMNINNETIYPFGIHGGICQGFHVAPYLFVIIVAVLNVAIKNVVRMGLIIGMYTFLNILPNK